MVFPTPPPPPHGELTWRQDMDLCAPIDELYGWMHLAATAGRPEEARFSSLENPVVSSSSSHRASWWIFPDELAARAAHHTFRHGEPAATDGPPAAFSASWPVHITRPSSSPSYESVRRFAVSTTPVWLRDFAEGDATDLLDPGGVDHGETNRGGDGDEPHETLMLGSGSGRSSSARAASCTMAYEWVLPRHTVKCSSTTTTRGVEKGRSSLSASTPATTTTAVLQIVPTVVPQSWPAWISSTARAAFMYKLGPGGRAPAVGAEADDPVSGTPLEWQAPRGGEGGKDSSSEPVGVSLGKEVRFSRIERRQHIPIPVRSSAAPPPSPQHPLRGDVTNLPDPFSDATHRRVPPPLRPSSSAAPRQTGGRDGRGGGLQEEKKKDAAITVSQGKTQSAIRAVGHQGRRFDLTTSYGYVRAIMLPLE